MTTAWQDSLELVAQLQSHDGDDVVPACATQFLTHDAPTDRAVLLLHGYTNAPVQFREIAQAFFDSGANVLVPRIPFHGLKDPFNREMSELTPELLATFTEETVAAAAGLGTHLTVAGLSLGGLLVAYAAADLDAVDTAIMIAPFMQPKAVPLWVDRPFDAAMRAIPDVYNWWNPKLKEAEVRGTYAYPKFSLRAVAVMIDFRRRLQEAPVRRTDKLQLVRLIVNDHDIAVRNDIATEVTREILTPIAEKIEIDTIDGSLGLTHDLAEPNGDNRDKMDAARSALWPLLGLAAPAPGSIPRTPTPGGGYFAEDTGSEVEGGGS